MNFTVRGLKCLGFFSVWVAPTQNGRSFLVRDTSSGTFLTAKFPDLIQEMEGASGHTELGNSRKVVGMAVS